MSAPIRWGILGTGDIARQMAEDLHLAAGAELLAVGSRSAEKAERFGQTHRIPRRYGSYESLVSDPDIDAVYIATPHPCHKANTLLCLDHNKAVLCEKPFALNRSEAEGMITRARERQCFLMEAMWMYFFPAIRTAHAWITDGRIGRVRVLQANLCYTAEWNPAWRLFNRELGGGALLDIGVYPVALARLVFGADPVGVCATAHLGSTGVDEEVSLSLAYPCGGVASLTCSLRVTLPESAWIGGSDGWIALPRFSQPDEVILHRDGGQEAQHYTRRGYGYTFEAEAATQCVRDGALECPLMPLETTRGIIDTLDAVRAAIGLHYPGEETGEAR